MLCIRGARLRKAGLGPLIPRLFAGMGIERLGPRFIQKVTASKRKACFFRGRTALKD